MPSRDLGTPAHACAHALLPHSQRTPRSPRRYDLVDDDFCIVIASDGVWDLLTIDEAAAIALVKDAIRAGIFNDLGSGSNVDVTIIRTGGEATVLRGYETPNDTRPLREAYVRPKALVPVKATAVLSTQVEVTDADAMEL